MEKRDIMINKRLINTISESKKYIAANVALQWLSLAANIVMMTAVTWFLAGLFTKEDSDNAFGITLTAVLCAALVRFACSVLSVKMGYLSSKAVKRTLREKIYA